MLLNRSQVELGNVVKKSLCGICKNTDTRTSGLGIICLVCLGCLSFIPTSFIASVLCTCISMYIYMWTQDYVAS